MEPIASYSEKEFLLQRRHELFADHITWSVKQRARLQGDGSFMLKNLQPVPEYRRSSRLGMGLVGISAMLGGWGTALLLLLSLSDSSEWVRVIIGTVLMTLVGLIGAALAAENLSRRETYLYLSDAGIAVIGFNRSTKTADRADRFRDALTTQIKKCRAVEETLPAAD